METQTKALRPWNPLIPFFFFFPFPFLSLFFLLPSLGVPENMTACMQPLDVKIMGPMKACYSARWLEEETFGNSERSHVLYDYERATRHAVIAYDRVHRSTVSSAFSVSTGLPLAPSSIPIVQQEMKEWQTALEQALQHIDDVLNDFTLYVSQHTPVATTAPITCSSKQVRKRKRHGNA